MQDTARKALVASLIVVAVVASALALWKLRILLAGLFLALIIAAAMRPSVEWLAQRRIPRGIGILLHYAVLAGLIAVLLWAIVPRAIDQVDNALGGIPTSSSELERQTSQSTGFKHEILARVQDGLDELPSGTELVDSSLSLTFTAFEVLVGIFFTFACAAYWIFERDRAEILVMSLLAARETASRARHLEPDRREARCLRPRPLDPRHVRRLGALVDLLLDRAPVLAPDRDLRRDRRDRPRARADRGGRRRRRAWGSPTRGSSRSPPGSPCSACACSRITSSFRACSATRSGSRRSPCSSPWPPWGSCSAASPSSSRSRSQRCWPRFWTSSCAHRNPAEEDTPAVLFPAKENES